MDLSCGLFLTDDEIAIKDKHNNLLVTDCFHKHASIL